MWKRFNKAISDNPENAKAIGSYLKLVGSDTNEFGVSGEFKLLAPHNTAYTYASTFAPVMVTTASIRMSDSGESQTSNNNFATMHMVAADVDAIQFKFTSGNIESGEITMFGVVNS